jgi:hypothetical protein
MQTPIAFSNTTVTIAKTILHLAKTAKTILSLRKSNWIHLDWVGQFERKRHPRLPHLIENLLHWFRNGSRANLQQFLNKQINFFLCVCLATRSSNYRQNHSPSSKVKLNSPGLSRTIWRKTSPSATSDRNTVFFIGLEMGTLVQTSAIFKLTDKRFFSCVCFFFA